MKLLQLNLWGRVAMGEKRLAQEVMQFTDTNWTGMDENTKKSWIVAVICEEHLPPEQKGQKFESSGRLPIKAVADNGGSCFNLSSVRGFYANNGGSPENQTDYAHLTLRRIL